MSIDFDNMFGSGGNNKKNRTNIFELYEDVFSGISTKKKKKRKGSGGFDEIFNMAGIGGQPFLGLEKEKRGGNDFSTSIKRKKRSKQAEFLGVRDDTVIFGLQNFGNAVGKSENFLQSKEIRGKIGSDADRIQGALRGRKTGRFVTKEVRNSKTGRISREYVLDKAGNPIKSQDPFDAVFLGRTLRPQTKDKLRKIRTSIGLRKSTRSSIFGSAPSSLITAERKTEPTLFRSDLIPRAPQNKKTRNFLPPTTRPQVRPENTTNDIFPVNLSDPTDSFTLQEGDILNAKGKKQKKIRQPIDQATNFGDFIKGEEREREEARKQQQINLQGKNSIRNVLLNQKRTAERKQSILGGKPIQPIGESAMEKGEKPIVIGDGKRFRKVPLRNEPMTAGILLSDSLYGIGNRIEKQSEKDKETQVGFDASPIGSQAETRIRKFKQKPTNDVDKMAGSFFEKQDEDTRKPVTFIDDVDRLDLQSELTTGKLDDLNTERSNLKQEKSKKIQEEDTTAFDNNKGAIIGGGAKSLVDSPEDNFLNFNVAEQVKLGQGRDGIKTINDRRKSGSTGIETLDVAENLQRIDDRPNSPKRALSDPSLDEAIKAKVQSGEITVKNIDRDIQIARDNDNSASAKGRAVKTLKELKRQTIEANIQLGNEERIETDTSSVDEKLKISDEESFNLSDENKERIARDFARIEEEKDADKSKREFEAESRLRKKIEEDNPDFISDRNFKSGSNNISELEDGKTVTKSRFRSAFDKLRGKLDG